MGCGALLIVCQRYESCLLLLLLRYALHVLLVFIVNYVNVFSYVMCALSMR